MTSFYSKRATEARGERNNCTHALTHTSAWCNIYTYQSAENSTWQPLNYFGLRFQCVNMTLQMSVPHVPFPFPWWKHVRRLLSWNCSFAIRGIPGSSSDEPFFLSPSPFFPFLFYGNWGLNQRDVFPQKRFVLIHYEGAGDSLPLLPSYWEVIAGLRSESEREWVWDTQRDI